ncbi:hypothetical protein ACMYR3_11870 [Ampullimonas aquatilis]|uniref:hypothetical protein n=1 Tax=Ampullimonas aquatilis TaxID=1341549 RepID=UPI003C7953BE
MNRLACFLLISLCTTELALAQGYYSPAPAYPGYPAYSGYPQAYPNAAAPYAVVPVTPSTPYGPARVGRPYVMVPIAPPDPRGLPYTFSAATLPPMAQRSGNTSASQPLPNQQDYSKVRNKKIRDALNKEQKALNDLEASRRILRYELGNENVSDSLEVTEAPAE